MYQEWCNPTPPARYHPSRRLRTFSPTGSGERLSLLSVQFQLFRLSFSVKNYSDIQKTMELEDDIIGILKCI